MEGMAAGQTAVVLEISHVIADGVGWLLLLMPLVRWKSRRRATAKGIRRPGDGEGERTTDVRGHRRPGVTEVTAPRRPP